MQGLGFQGLGTGLWEHGMGWGLDLRGMASNNRVTACPGQIGARGSMYSQRNDGDSVLNKAIIVLAGQY